MAWAVVLRRVMALLLRIRISLARTTMFITFAKPRAGEKLRILKKIHTGGVTESRVKSKKVM